MLLLSLPGRGGGGGGGGGGMACLGGERDGLRSITDDWPDQSKSAFSLVFRETDSLNHVH